MGVCKDNGRQCGQTVRQRVPYHNMTPVQMGVYKDNGRQCGQTVRQRVPYHNMTPAQKVVLKDNGKQAVPINGDNIPPL